MPDFLVSTKVVTRDQSAGVFDKAGKAVDRFGKKADASFDRASRSSKDFTQTFLRGIERMERRTRGFQGVTAGVLGADIIRAGFRGAAREVGSFITEAAKIERARTEFGIFLRSAEAGKKVISDLRALGARTPFEFQDFIRPTKILLAMRAATQDELIPVLTMLGDTAGGSADKLQRVAFAFAEVKANGRATMQEIRQFTNAGVPLLATVADMHRQVGDSTEQTMLRMRAMVRQGKLTGDVMTKAFKKMTSEGGRFFQGMSKTSRDFQGRVSTLKDEIIITKGVIGEQLLPTMKEYVNRGIEIARTISQWAKNNDKLIKREFLKWMATGKQILKDMWPVVKGVFLVFSDLLPVIRELIPILPWLAAGWLFNKIALGFLTGIEIIQGLKTVILAIKSAAIAQGFWGAMITISTGGMNLLIPAIILGITIFTAGIVLIVRNWDWLMGKVESGVAGMTKLFFGFLRIAVWPIIGGIRLIANGMVKMARLTGMKTVEKEFTSLIRVMDDLDFMLKKAAGQLPAPFKIAENFVQRTRVKFGGIIPLQFQPAFVEPGSLESIFGDFSVKGKTPDLATPSPLFSAGNFTKLVERTIIEQKKADTSFQLPQKIIETINQQKTIIEHQIKLAIAGAPEGSKVTFNSGAQAPPVDVNLLGENN